jgi:hypothetical protein
VRQFIVASVTIVSGNGPLGGWAGGKCTKHLPTVMRAIWLNINRASTIGVKNFFTLQTLFSKNYGI